MEKENLNNLLAGFEISSKIGRYEILAEFLKQAGRQFYLKEVSGDTPSAEDIKTFTDKFQEFKGFAEKLCSLSTTKA